MPSPRPYLAFELDALPAAAMAAGSAPPEESVDSPTVRFKLISPLRPAVLEGESDDYTYLIMPIRLAG